MLSRDLNDSSKSVSDEEQVQQDYLADFRITKYGEVEEPDSNKKPPSLKTPRRRTESVPPAVRNARERKDLCSDETFLTEMAQCLKQLETDVKLKIKLSDTIALTTRKFEDEKFQENLQNVETVKNRLR